MHLQDKNIVILGGTSGIGFATARAALAQGAKVIVSSSNKDKVDTAIAALGAGASGFAADVNNAASMGSLFKEIGHVDHLVYTAGESLLIGNLDSIDMDAIRKAFDVRVFGAMAAIKAALPYLQQGGSIVLSSGIASSRAPKGLTIGASICSAMEGLTRALAVELAPLRVNIVSPGFVRTPLWSNMPDDDREAMYQHAGSSLLVGRVGEADEIAQAYLYLMNNTFVTGQTVVIDGGGVLV